MNENITLSVVMPAYNEGQHIYDNLVETDKILSTFVRRYEIIAVNDGSKDNTWDEIKEQPLSLPQSQTTATVITMARDTPFVTE